MCEQNLTEGWIMLELTVNESTAPLEGFVWTADLSFMFDGMDCREVFCVLERRTQSKDRRPSHTWTYKEMSDSVYSVGLYMSRTIHETLKAQWDLLFVLNSQTWCPLISFWADLQWKHHGARRRSCHRRTGGWSWSAAEHWQSSDSQPAEKHTKTHIITAQWPCTSSWVRWGKTKEREITLIFVQINPL